MLHLDKIRNLCDRGNITLKQLAQELKLSERTIHLMLNQNTTKFSTLEEISRFFNVDISYFFQTEEEEQNIFFQELEASFKFSYEYDIRTLFKVEEERFLKESVALKSYIEKNKSIYDDEVEVDTSIFFTRSMIFEDSIKNLFYSLNELSNDALEELTQICDNILHQLYKVLRDETIKPFIREEMFSPKDVDIILKTYFLKDSVLLKPKIWLIKNQPNNF